MSSASVVRWKRATGIAVGNDRVVAVTVAWMPAAAREVSTTEVPLGEGGLAAALADLHEKGALSGPVTVGLDARSVFFIARPKQGNAEIDPQALLESHFAAARPDGGLVGDAVAVKVRGAAYVALAACRRATADQVQQGLAPIPHAIRHLEPAPFALLRLAQRAAGAPRSWKTTIRVLIDGTKGLAILTRGRAPLAWRPFSAAQGRELDGVSGAVRGLAAHARADLDISAVDGVLFHAAPSLAGTATDAASTCGLEVRLEPFVAMDETSLAQGLALGATQGGAEAPNLLRQLRPALSIHQIFPWGTAAAVAVTALVCWQALAGAVSTCEGRIAKARGRIASAMKAARTKPSDLKPARAAARHEAELVSRFIVGRAPWATILHELPSRLPASSVLIGFTGRDQLVLPSVDKPDEKYTTARDLSIQGQLRVSKADATPEDVAEVLSGVADFKLLLDSFPRVEGAEVTRHPGREEDIASFVVRCASKR